MNPSYQQIITIEPGKRGGKPCIRGLRITVDDVLDYFAAGMTEQEILEDFDYLTHEDILACFAFAADRERHTRVISGCCAVRRESIVQTGTGFSRCFPRFGAC